MAGFRERRVSPEEIIAVQSEPNLIRNICILAHVDHGLWKTIHAFYVILMILDFLFFTHRKDDVSILGGNLLIDCGCDRLSDHLISSNGIISQKLAGTMRFLDSTFISSFQTLLFLRLFVLLYGVGKMSRRGGSQ